MKQLLPRIRNRVTPTLLLLSAIVALAMLMPTGVTALSVLGFGFAGMILDERTEFADAVSVAAAAGTALIGDVIDSSVVRDLGNGQPVYLVISVDTEIITGGVAGTVQFKLVSDAQAAIAVDGTASEHFVSKAFVTDDAAANDPQLDVGGVPVCIALPSEGVKYERFLGILAVTATTTTTAGKINAFLTLDPAKYKSYPNEI